jgi:hypothetical protein
MPGQGFVNAALHDYRPTAASRAIDAGTAIPGITDGYQGTAPDAGAYEYGGTDWIAGCTLPACLTTTTPFLGIKAASYSGQSGVQLEAASEGGQDVSWISAGDHTAYSGLGFTAAPTTFYARVASPRTTPGTIEVRLGSATGTLAGTCTVPATGNWQTYTTASCPVTGIATGTQSVYLVYRGSGTSSLFNLLWFRFATDPDSTVNPYNTVQAEMWDAQSGTQWEVATGGTGTDVSWISNGDYLRYDNLVFGATGPTAFTASTASTGTGGTIEIRLDSATGTLAGSCTVPGTGGWQVYTSTSCAVNGITGTHTVYLVFTGGAGNLMNLDWFRFS